MVTPRAFVKLEIAGSMGIGSASSINAVRSHRIPFPDLRHRFAQSFLVGRHSVKGHPQTITISRPCS